MQTIVRPTPASRLACPAFLAATFLALSGLPARADSASSSASASASASASEAAASAGADEVVSLPTLQVTASADASAEGLRQAYAGGQVATGGRVGLLGSLDFMESPYALNAYTQELIANQQAASVGEVLLNDPGVRVARGFGNFQQLYLVRGLPVYSDDMAYNGLYGLLPRQYLAAELLERVEVFHGANAFLNGAAPGGSGLGGAVNVVPKRAANADFASLTAGIQSGGEGYGALDLSRRFDGRKLGLRLNLAERDGDTAIAGESTELHLASIGADLRLPGLRLSADLGYQDHHKAGSMPSITFASGLAISAAPDASSATAQPWSFSNERDRFGTLRAETDLGGSATLWLAGGWRNSHEAASFANPTVIDSAGDTSAYRFDNVREDSVRTGELGLRVKAETGPMSHAFAAVATGFDSRSRNAYAFSNFAGFSSNLYHPVAVSAPAANYFTGGLLSAPLVTEQVNTASLAFSDSLSALKGTWLLNAGLRFQSIGSRSFNYNTGLLGSAYERSAATPSLGILHRLNRQLSLYGNYIEGLTQGDIAPTVSGTTVIRNGGALLDPYKTRQYEAGLKWDLGRFGGSLGFYQSAKPSAGVDSNGVYRVLSRQHNRGLDLNLFGQLDDHWRVLGGLSLLHSETSMGKRSIGAPELQANLGFEYEVSGLKGLVLEARGIATGPQFADASNSQRVQSWERLDLGLRYQWTRSGTNTLTARLRVENVADRSYWASAGGYPGAGYLTLGAPRTAVLSLSLGF